jgi:hypothetical protein
MARGLLSMDGITLVTIALAVVIGMLWFSRILANWYSAQKQLQKTNASSGISFERLVENKKAELRAAGLAGRSLNNSAPHDALTPGTPPRPTRAAATKLAYQKIIQERPQEAAHYQPILDLIEHAAWGEGKRYQEIRRQFKGHCQVEVGLEVVARIMHDLLANDTQTILALGDHPPPTYAQVQDLIEAQIWHYVREHQPELLAQAFAHRKNLPSAEVQTALERHPWKKLELVHHKKFISVMDLEEELRQAALKVALSRPLPDTSHLDQTLACELLGAKESDSVTKIKKLYKQAALRYHPDRLVQRGGDPQIAQQNFEKIQQAYQFLRQQRRKAS